MSANNSMQVAITENSLTKGLAYTIPGIADSHT